MMTSEPMRSRRSLQPGDHGLRRAVLDLDDQHTAFRWLARHGNGGLTASAMTRQNGILSELAPASGQCPVRSEGRRQSFVAQD
jgi:hypothetical protein